MSEQTIGSISLYEMNQQIMSQQPVLDPIEFNTALNEIGVWFNKGVRYFMLLCHEDKNFTLFNIDLHNPTAYAEAAKELGECLVNRGLVLSIEYDNNSNAFEIWIKDDESVKVYYLFQYDEGVIEV